MSEQERCIIERNCVTQIRGYLLSRLRNGQGGEVTIQIEQKGCEPPTAPPSQEDADRILAALRAAMKKPAPTVQELLPAEFELLGAEACGEMIKIKLRAPGYMLALFELGSGVAETQSPEATP